MDDIEDLTLDDVTSFVDDRIFNHDIPKITRFLNYIKNKVKTREDLNNFKKEYNLNHVKNSIILQVYKRNFKILDTRLELLLTNKLAKTVSGVCVVTLFTSPEPSWTDINGNVKKQTFSCGKNCAYCPQQPELKINSFVTNIEPHNSNFLITFKTDLNIDKFRVITYIETESGRKIFCKNYLPKHFDNKLKTFKVVINGKFRSILQIGDSVTCVRSKQARSYLDDEPGVMRSNQCNHDCHLQFFNRTSALWSLNHKIDKLTILILGGTWSHYPTEYQIEFMRDVYYSANVFYDKLDGKVLRDRLSLEEEIKLHESSECRLVEVTTETRPDCINLKEIKKLRRYNVTRVQLGVQHIDDDILEKIERGCYNKDTIKALELLKDNGIKPDIHLMPGLPDSSYEKDYNMFKYLLGIKNITNILYLELFEIAAIVLYLIFFMKNDFQKWLISIYMLYKYFFSNFEYYELTAPELQADQWKLYPTMITDYTKIKEWYDKGEYRPYLDEKMDNGFTKLTNLFLFVKPRVFPWIRLNRIVRDIPPSQVRAGFKNVVLRDQVKNIMKKKGLNCKCIRCREIKQDNYFFWDIKKVVRKYNTLNGYEYFISFESLNEKKIYGFCRLRINYSQKNMLDAIKNCALIRELHVYGIMVSHNSKDKTKTQHNGIGKKLLQTAEYISLLNGYRKIAVISGVGVREYYNKRGYNLETENNYMIKKIF